jgi:hypothetical protein
MGKLLLRIVLGKDNVYVIYNCLQESKLRAELIGNKMRRDYIERLMSYFEVE